VSDSDKFWQKHEIRADFYRDSSDPQASYLVFRPAQGLAEPDLLLYWVDEELRGHSLPADARLLRFFRRMFQGLANLFCTA
jgi:hypothetical protein